MLKTTPLSIPLLVGACLMVSVQANAQEFVNKPADLPFNAVNPKVAGFSEEGLRNIDRFLANEMEKKRVPGAVLGILRDGKLVYLKAHGVRDPAAQAPMQTDTIFALASMTKPMVAVGALALTQQGRLPLFSKVADYHPAVGAMKVAVKKPDGSVTLEAPKRQMTVQDLMRHTSGLTYGGRPDTSGGALAPYPAGGELPGMKGTSEFVQRISGLSLVHQPGTVFEYSTSFEMLGAVLEKVSGLSLDAYLREAIWTPLGMSDTGFHVAQAKLRAGPTLSNSTLWMASRKASKCLSKIRHSNAVAVAHWALCPTICALAKCWSMAVSSMASGC